MWWSIGAQKRCSQQHHRCITVCAGRSLAHSIIFFQDFDRKDPPKDSINLLGSKIEVVGDKNINIRGASAMCSLDLRVKSKEEQSEWRLAFEHATSPVTTSFEERIIETKKIYTQMSEVIQKHVDELQSSREDVDNDSFGTALQVRQSLLFVSYVNRFFWHLKLPNRFNRWCHTYADFYPEPPRLWPVAETKQS